ncbi:MAG: hypothetical protein HY735_36990 [Verrucomicrobia bacterium]|nr:hypothetical protein [Verrucomicrobiota bacterium]
MSLLTQPLTFGLAASAISAFGRRTRMVMVTDGPERGGSPAISDGTAHLAGGPPVLRLAGSRKGLARMARLPPTYLASPCHRPCGRRTSDLLALLGFWHVPGMNLDRESFRQP